MTSVLNIVKYFWPELDLASEEDRKSGVINVLGFLYSTPLVIVGIGWLIAVTDLALIRTEWYMFILFFVLIILFEKLDFFLLIEIKPGSYSTWQSSLESLIVWSAVLIIGPSALWLSVIWWVIWLLQKWRKSFSTFSRWQVIRNFNLNIASTVFAGLVAITIYENLVGNLAFNDIYPLPGLNIDIVVPALFATFVRWFLGFLIWLPLSIYYIVSRSLIGTALKNYLRYMAISTASYVFTYPFAILLAGVYSQLGLGVFLFLVFGLLLASLVAHRLSHNLERSEQRTRELNELEKLSHALYICCPDVLNFPDVLEQHVPNMFPYSRIEIHAEYPPFLTIQTLLRNPLKEKPLPISVWEWQKTTFEAYHFPPGAVLPWGGKAVKDGVVMVPILDIDSGEIIGGIHLARSRDPNEVSKLIPAIQSLAAQVASALHSMRVYKQTLTLQRIEQELSMAAQIQNSFLPTELPDIPDWQIVALLQPALETSGYFYDFIPLPDEKLGIVVADVADKGMGAALYMALSRTIIRSSTKEHSQNPDSAMGIANRRILEDTQSSMFVTVFYGVLDPTHNTLTYCNAGHNPPYIISSENEKEIQPLTKTGMALGVVDDMDWEQKTVALNKGDVLVLYTDGISEAQNKKGDFYGENRMLDVLKANQNSTALQIQDSIMNDISKFMNEAPMLDDLTLMIIVSG